jgi:hypothetical protein
MDKCRQRPVNAASLSEDANDAAPSAIRLYVLQHYRQLAEGRAAEDMKVR